MKVTIRENFRVEVTPRALGHCGSFTIPDERMSGDPAAAYRERCEEIATAVGRHVDNVEAAIVRYDTRHECSFCGLTWEVLTAADAANPRSRLDEHSVEGEPVCCDEAIAEFRTERGIPAEGSDEACGPASAIRSEQTDSGWRVRWQQDGRRRAKTLPTQGEADLLASSLAKGGESS
ncbi:hypothetical protein [Streptomyces indicus]|uniref:Uncharacterized protein n=1 Tax=Streptomyces indicus TaxID=417292 RepID=A0A1G9J9P3_9ACTN|nr:hypothetical protein [Streptomyces indicus]SDL33854.1 hypothetical protein SAMN05421806_12850 [Streptomyces indicus]